MRGSYSASLLAILAVACAPASQEMASEADVEAIRMISTSEVTAINTADVDAGVAILADDAVAMPPNEPARTGKEAVRAWVEGLHDAFTVELSYPSREIDVAGDWAIERYLLEVTLTPKAGGEAMQESGKGIHIYRRQADGSWKMIYDIWNFDRPQPAM